MQLFQLMNKILQTVYAHARHQPTEFNFFFFKSIVYEPYATENKHARLELFHCKALLQTSQSV